MNCRKVSGLLSAYLDQELTGEEMLAVRAHLGDCPLCRSEYQSLADTKRLLASLALQTPRADLEQLLLTDADRVARPWAARLIPDFVRDWVSFHRVAADEEPRPQPAPAPVRLRPLAATAALSLAGLCLATAKLSGPHEESAQGIASADLMPGYASFTVVAPVAPVAAPPVRQVIVPVAPPPSEFLVPQSPHVHYGRALTVAAPSWHREDPFAAGGPVLVAPAPPRVSIPASGSPYSYGSYHGGGMGPAATATAAYVGF